VEQAGGDILASIPDAPTCGECQKQTAEIDEKGSCRVCAPKLSIAEKARAEVAATKAEARPSLEVETEVHQNLKPRMHAHVGRMRAWDLRKLPLEARNEFACALDAFALGQSRLETALSKLFAEGFVAKTTPATRLASKLEPGAHVAMRDDVRATFATVYTDEQLDSLTVVRTTDTHVLLQAGDSSNIGLVKIIHVEVKP
jgi:predicted amidophosphoribosyltransferase